MKIVKCFFISLALGLFLFSPGLSQPRSLALETSVNLSEKIIKNFTFHLAFSGESVTLKNGRYKTPLRPGNKEDMAKYLQVRIEKYLLATSSLTNQPLAIVILSENSGGSGTFFQVTVLVKEKDKITQTNSIILGDRIVIKDLKFQKDNSASPEEERKDKILLSFLTHKENDPSCCPSQLREICLSLVYDENLKEIKLLAPDRDLSL